MMSMKNAAVATVVAAMMLVAAPAKAQSLRLPATLLVIAGAADVTTTGMGGFWNGTGTTQEDNIAINWIGNPKVMLVTGVAMESVATWFLAKKIAKNHPKLARVGLYAMTGIHATLAVRNHRLNQSLKGGR
jgi:hypothetical protein